MSADPVSLSLLALSAAQGIGRMQAQSRAARRQARYYTEQAAAQRAEADVQERELRRRNRQALGRQRALYARSGVGIEGSPLQVQEEAATSGELDALALRRAGDIRATRLLAEAARTRAAQRGALNANIFNAGRTLLTGLSRPPTRFPVVLG